MTIVLPPCIKKAVAMKDNDALDDIFSYLKSFADDETRDAVLWSIGYYDLLNWKQRKLTAESQINSSPFFICTPFEKPTRLEKYCSRDDEHSCPLRDPVRKFDLLIEYAKLEYDPRFSVADVEIKLRDGSRFVRKNAIYHPFNDKVFWDYTINRFLDWYVDTHQGEFPDVVIPSIEATKNIIFKKLTTVVRNDSPAVRETNVV